jgi:hypothetical protein
VLPAQSVDLAAEGVERFYTKLPTWKLDVQGVEVNPPAPTITVCQALELANINPDLRWTFVLKVDGKKEQVELTTVIDLTKPGIEHLRVMPKVINNGEGPYGRAGKAAKIAACDHDAVRKVNDFFEAI